MRFSRFIAIFALTAALALPGVLATSSAQAAAKPHRHFNYTNIVKLPNGSLSFRARIAKYPNGYIGLMKKTCLSCTWARVAIRKTDGTGRVASAVQAPNTGRWYWRYRTAETAHFALTYSRTWYTYRQ